MTANTQTVPSGSTRPQPRLSTLQQALLSVYWFATNLHWSIILIVTLPTQSLLIGGDAVKGTVMGTVLAFGAFVSMIVAPIFGALSDRTPTRWGRRRPWMVVGVAANCVGLVALAYIPREGDLSTLWPFILAFMFVEFANNVASAPYAALIPDVVPPDQRGSASGWLGLMIMLGSLLGGLAGLFITALGGIAGLYWVAIAGLVLGMLVTVLGIHEPPAPPVTPFNTREFLRKLLSPFDSHDFRWVFWTRFLVMMGIFTVQQFLLFYMKDVIRTFDFLGTQLVTLPQEAVSLFLLALLLGAMVSALTAGILSDRYGRKIMVYLAGGLMGFVAAVFVFGGNFTLGLLLGVVFGLGYGAYNSVDWALATDVLPSIDDYAKDMGVWHVAEVFPQVAATPIAGFLLDRFQVVGRGAGLPNLGYTVIFSLAVVYFVLGTVFVRRIRGVR